MRRYEGYSPVKSVRREVLPSGGYVIRIKTVKEITFSSGPCLAVLFDIAEGEKSNFFSTDFETNTYEDKKWRGVHYLNQPLGDGSERDGWAVNAMNNFVAVLHESNPGYTWNWGPIEAGDYSQLKGKLLGALMGRVQWEYQGKTGWNTKCRAFIPAQDVRDGHFEVPGDKELKRSARTQTSGAAADDDMSAFDDDDDLPF